MLPLSIALNTRDMSLLMYLRKRGRLNLTSHVRGKDLPARLNNFCRFLSTLLRFSQTHQQHTLCNFLQKVRLSELLDALLRRQRILLRRVRFARLSCDSV
jgi:hypothetical protein